ncbi:CRISPR system Cascade subunit CasB [Spinactinospora alkalitolerans]|uniref:CRISPR system Cascade subunit CasB n=1 Tax=Spinactinospora alkalitolerans TaxID=687207 RepID=A0A852U3D5_9ACTN|nr:type I-E CRISPR-associated protein Cse2/CasB [Spinactinospora alkalitolerans]NYE50709.1 CRISPR system Cascade subunit CasB [Spinactinospora alkalitolerans]
MTETAKDPRSQSHWQRRSGYVAELYKFGRALESKDRHQVATARRTLARLRRSLVDDRFLLDAMAIADEFDPPKGGKRDETEPWLFTAGLYALHPLSPRDGDRRLPLGTALRTYSARASVQARLRQLLAADWPTLRNRLRQAVQMLGGSGIALDYRTLLDDLVVLHREPIGGVRVHTVHLRWASDFQRGARKDRSDDGDAGPDHDTDDEAGDLS